MLRVYDYLSEHLPEYYGRTLFARNPDILHLRKVSRLLYMTQRNWERNNGRVDWRLFPLPLSSCLPTPPLHSSSTSQSWTSSFP